MFWGKYDIFKKTFSLLKQEHDFGDLGWFLAAPGSLFGALGSILAAQGPDPAGILVILVARGGVGCGPENNATIPGSGSATFSPPLSCADSQLHQ